MNTLAVATIAAALSLSGLGSEATAQPSPDRTVSERGALNAKVFDEAWGLVQRLYYDEDFNGVDWAALGRRVRPEALAARSEAELYIVLNRMLGGLQDLHTTAHPPTSVRAQASGAGAFIGWRTRPEEGGQRVTHVRSGSPADQAGVEPGWLVLSVDGEPFPSGRPAVPGRPVRVQLRGPAGEIREVQLTPAARAEALQRSTSRPQPGVQIIQMGHFARGASEWLEARLRSTDRADRLVLDLRGNPGGHGPELANALGCFLPKGTPVAQHRPRKGGVLVLSPKVLKTSGRCSARWSGPLVVLVDENTSSAAEVFTAAIQENGRGKVLGRRTAGAVLDVTERNLPDGGRLSLSVQDMLTGTGTRLEGRGVEPDVAAETSRLDRRAGRDPALELAIEVVTGRS